MKVNNLVERFTKSNTPQLFGYKDVKSSVWLPLCRWNKSNIPDNVYLEVYYKIIKTHDKIVKKFARRLRIKNKIIFSNWKFNFLPKDYKVVRSWLFAKIPENKICISLKVSTNKWDSFIIPAKFNLSLKDFVAFGLLKGEMINSIRGKSKHYASFTNSSPELINRIIDLFRKFYMDSFISFQVIANTKEIDIFDDHDYIRYWSEILNVPKKRFVKVFRDQRYKTKNKYGSLSLKIYSTPFRCFIQFLVNDIGYYNEEHCINFLKGLFAAEGNVNLSYNDSLNFVAIGGSKKEDIILYKILLRKIGIKPGWVRNPVTNDNAGFRGWKSGTGGFMCIQGFDNFRKIYHFNLLGISKDKLVRFLYGLKNHKIAKKSEIYDKIIKDLKTFDNIENISKKYQKLTKNQEKVIKIVEKNGGFITSIRIAKTLGINRSSASRILEGIKVKGKITKYRDKRIIIWKVL